jgi:rhamnosyltransferase
MSLWKPRKPAGAEVGVVVVTHRARDHLPHCLPPLLASPLRPRVMVVNSASGDGTVEMARALGAEVLVVPRRAFNHGATREAARRRLGTPIVVMMTPDVRPRSADMLEALTAPVRDGRAAVAYARQVARPDADPIERFGRDFCFPDRSALRSAEDWARQGTAAHYCSNACAAWSSAALDAIGGFPTTLVSEETIAVVELLRRGHRLAYVAEAVVEHSHPTALAPDFRRAFDVGYTRRLFRDHLLAAGRDEARGVAYLRGLLARLARERPGLLPYAVLHTAVRFVGYRLGLLGPHLPDAIAARLSGQDFFWTSTVRPAPLRLRPETCASRS